MFKRRHRSAAPATEGTTPGGIDRRRLMSLGGRVAVGAAGAAVIGLADGPAAGAVTDRDGAAPTAVPGAARGVHGPASFARSGVVSMVSSRQTVSVPGGLTRQSRVLATINSDPDQLGFFPVVAAAPDPTTGTIKIQTNSFGGQPPYPQVAWFVFE
jgi:hypothetical protein